MPGFVHFSLFMIRSIGSYRFSGQLQIFRSCVQSVAEGDTGIIIRTNTSLQVSVALVASNWNHSDKQRAITPHHIWDRG